MYFEDADGFDVTDSKTFSPPWPQTEANPMLHILTDFNNIQLMPENIQIVDPKSCDGEKKCYMMTVT